MMRLSRLLLAIMLLVMTAFPANAQEVRLKDLGRFSGYRDNILVGYGIITGLAGTGDSPRSEITRQTLKNVLGRLDLNVSADQLQSRNVAAVMVTAVLRGGSNVGDRVDVTVTSIGDARSIVGGTLLMTPLLGADHRVYALAQGSLVVGGYRFDSRDALRQKNFPTAGQIVGGATIEVAVRSDPTIESGRLTFILDNPDVTTAERIVDAINLRLGPGVARVRGADAVTIESNGGNDPYRLISTVESLTVRPDSLARIVINEKTGTVVAGASVRISAVVISQGDIRVSVTVDNQSAGSYYPGGPSDALVISNTRLDVSRSKDAVIRLPDTSVGDLVEGLSRLHVNTREIISILQALKAAGALHAEIIVQ